MGPAQSQGPGERGQGKYIHTSRTLGVQGWTPEAMSEESGHLELIQSSPWSGAWWVSGAVGVATPLLGPPPAAST